MLQCSSIYRFLAWFSLCLFGMSAGWAKEERISLKYQVSKISFRYGQEHPALPDLAIIRETTLTLRSSGEEIILEDLMRGASGLLNLDDRDLHDLAEIAVHLLKDSGFDGVLALPNPQMIDPVSGQDMRMSGDHSLEIVVWCSILDEVVVEGKGLQTRERERLEDRINRFVEEEKLKGEPIRAGLVEYISDMTNHPSRISRVVLSAGSEAGKVRAVVQAKRNENRTFPYRHRIRDRSPRVSGCLILPPVQTN